MVIGGLQKFTLLDYPGKIAATVFLAGCNFRCPFCYNPELVLPEIIKNTPKISERSFFKFLKERKDLLEGIVVCGGEPTIHQDLPLFIKKIKKIGFAVKLDTNGSNPQMLKKLIDQNLIDYVAMDVKAPKEKYQEITGGRCNSEPIEKSISILKASKIDYEFRTTVVPTLLSKDDILKIVKWISPAKKYFLQNFSPSKHIDHRFNNLKPYPEEYLLEIKKVIEPFFDVCGVRN